MAIEDREPGGRAAGSAAAGHVAMAGLLAVAVWAGSSAWSSIANPGTHVPELSMAFSSTSVPTIALVFQLMDCAGDRERLVSWNEVASHGRVNVVGILVGDGFTDQEVAAVIGDRLSFPVARDRRRRFTDLARSMGYVSTPLVLVFDTAGRVRAGGPLEHAWAVDHLLAAVHTLTEEADR